MVYMDFLIRYFLDCNLLWVHVYVGIRIFFDSLYFVFHLNGILVLFSQLQYLTPKLFCFLFHSCFLHHLVGRIIIIGKFPPYKNIIQL